MVAFRDIKRKARRDLHQRMQIAANYYLPGQMTFQTIGVRLTTKEATSDIGSNRYGFATAENVEPTIIFMLDTCDPAQGAVLSFETDEAYRVLDTEPPDDITVTAKCARLLADDAAKYTPPTQSATQIIGSTAPTSGGAPASALATSIYQQTLQIVVRNVIPPLDKPWKSAAGSLANIIIGAAFLTPDGGAVVFTDGSKQVLFNPEVAGFNLNPGDTVVAQYSTS